MGIRNVRRRGVKAFLGAGSIISLSGTDPHRWATLLRGGRGVFE
jgi:hypothetical protein